MILHRSAIESSFCCSVSVEIRRDDVRCNLNPKGLVCEKLFGAGESLEWPRATNESFMLSARVQCLWVPWISIVWSRLRNLPVRVA